MTISTFTLQYCQKLCLSIPTSTCTAFSTYAFTNLTPSILTLSSSSTGAIIYASSPTTGTGIIEVTENSIVVNIIYINIIGFTNPIDDFVYSTRVAGGSEFNFSGHITNVSSVISNPLNSLYSYFTCTTSITAYPSPSSNVYSYQNYAVIQSASPSPNLAYGSNAGPLANIGFLCLRNFPSSSFMNQLPITGKATFSLTTTPSLQSVILPSFSLACIQTNYACFVQCSTYNVPVTVYGSSINSQNTLQVLLATNSGSSTVTCSYFIALKGYSNFTNISGLVFCDIISVSFPNTANYTTFTINIPSSTNALNYVWFAQLNSVSISNLFVTITDSSATSGTTFGVYYNTSSGSTIVANISLFGFVNQSSGSMAITS